MSYDVDVAGAWFNITSNMSKFFRDFDVYPPDWEGKHRAVVAAEIEPALERIRRLDASLLADKYNSPNGWGSVETATAWLEEVLEACTAPLPSEIVRVTS